MRLKKVAIYTFGCKLNQVESEAIRESFERAGYCETSFFEEADVYVVNTCTVTHKTDHQARRIMRRAIDRKSGHPSVRVVVAGCYPQVSAEALVEEACDALGPYGEEAQTLKDAARFVIARKH